MSNRRSVRPETHRRLALLSRRHFLGAVAAAAPGAWMTYTLLGCSGRGAEVPDAPSDDGLDSSFALDSTQLATLRAVCETMLPTDQDPGAKEAGVAEFIATELSSYYFENSRGPALDGLGALDTLAQQKLGKPFAAASPEERDDVLFEFQTGKLTVKGVDGESIVQFLLALVLEGFLGDPIYGGNRDGVGWRMMGFHRCGPQPRRENLHRRPSDHPSRAQVTHAREEFDAIVVGSGAGGGPVAQILAEEGMRVLVLEKGPWYTKRDFAHDEIAMSRRDFFLPAQATDPHVIVDVDKKPEKSRKCWTSRCVGGGTVHMSGFFLRMHPGDFKLRSLIGEVPGATHADWPIDYSEMAPHYGWIERMMGVSGQLDAHQVGSPFPLPALRSHPFAESISEGARKLGAHAFPTPRAVLSRGYGGRPSCNYCGFCGSYGCENDSKSTSLSVFVPRALATGRCEIRPHCTARAVKTDDSGHARAVVYLDADGGEHEVRGKVVVIACSAIESARLLLMSQSGKWTNGLANTSGLVGRNLVFSTFGGGEGWLAREGASAEILRAIDSGLPFLQRTTQSYYWLPDAGLAHPKGGSIVFLLPHPNPIYTAEHQARASRILAWGKTLKDRIRVTAREGRFIEFEIFGEFLANEGTHVTLDPEVKDAMGLPVARIHRSLLDADRAATQYMVERGNAILEAAGCKNPRGPDVNSATDILQGGTCRFGTNPDEAVLDRDCQAFDVPRLFVTDGSFLPTSGGVPLTLTIMANAARVARRIVEMSKRGELG